MAKIKLEIIQPVKKKIEGEYDHVIVPGVDGDFGIMENHTPFITKIRPGILQLFNNRSSEEYAVHDGFVTVDDNIVKIVCDVIEHRSEIDKTRAASAKKRAEKRLKSNQEDTDFRRAEFALKRSLVRLEVIEK
ncbi:MAG: ATP synthase F1 subunit epsilon [Candidatus Cloacimonetes bacterium]|nr:ATP synthase F1 subunit epsilon [Candidatus Cloacimonadota bacterium]MCF7813849.1 ATP synthase F1 subunit epsilon [Candidatus Cloacimonadota bacterium]MCF7868287.1 ATP synthase F1 subunit epsilon [Candidatus Cloacimonadota bacterium]MCF7883739.1 ATP synthase F1 subunit epsilon [Candidatus Cloacimonadota bacterium]